MPPLRFGIYERRRLRRPCGYPHTRAGNHDDADDDDDGDDDDDAADGDEEEWGPGQVPENGVALWLTQFRGDWTGLGQT